MPCQHLSFCGIAILLLNIVSRANWVEKSQDKIYVIAELTFIISYANINRIKEVIISDGIVECIKSKVI